jgi:cytoskeletal protein CcmA (bactofilin family)
MKSSTLRELIIRGAGSSAGGVFERVKISGDGTAYGNIEAKQFKTSGRSKVKGDVKSDTFTVSGSSEIEGKLQADTIKISGSVEVGGGVEFHALNVQGTLSVDGPVAGTNIDLWGMLNVNGDCEAEVLNARGSFEVSGLLNAGVIDVKLYGACRAKEIGGETIRIVRSGFGFKLKSWFFSLFLGTHAGLEAETIEGDDIRLEYTKAKVVRGKKVSIGPGCEIDLVEYNESLELDDSVQLGDSKKL